MKNVIAAVGVVLFTAVGTFAQVKTSLQGRDVKQVCDVADYDKVLTLSGGSPQPAAVLFLDLTTIDGENKGAKAYFFDDPDATILKSIGSAVSQTCALASANRDFTPVLQVLPAKPAGSTRWIATAGDALWIFALAGFKADQTIQVLETKRKTHIALDLAQLAKLAKAAGFAAAAVNMVGFPYILQETRADLTVQVVSADGKNPQTVFSTKSGPPEQLSISANLPINTVKKLKLDENNNVQTKEAPKEFLLGLNYNFGDVYEEYDTWDAHRGFVTGMVRFSKQPLDTVGLGLGYNFGFVSAFGGPIWIRQPRASTSPTSQAGQQVQPSMRYKFNLRVGVTFDLATAVGWVTSSKK